MTATNRGSNVRRGGLLLSAVSLLAVFGAACGGSVDSAPTGEGADGGADGNDALPLDGTATCRWGGVGQALTSLPATDATSWSFSLSNDTVQLDNRWVVGCPASSLGPWGCDMWSISPGGGFSSLGWIGLPRLASGTSPESGYPGRPVLARNGVIAGLVVGTFLDGSDYVRLGPNANPISAKASVASGSFLSLFANDNGFAGGYADALHRGIGELTAAGDLTVPPDILPVIRSVVPLSGGGFMSIVQNQQSLEARRLDTGGRFLPPAVTLGTIVPSSAIALSCDEVAGRVGCMVSNQGADGRSEIGALVVTEEGEVVRGLSRLGGSTTVLVNGAPAAAGGDGHFFGAVVLKSGATASLLVNAYDASVAFQQQFEVPIPQDTAPSLVGLDVRTDVITVVVALHDSTGSATRLSAHTIRCN